MQGYRALWSVSFALEIYLATSWQFVSKMKQFVTTFSNKTLPELSTEVSLPSSNHSGVTLQAVFGIISFLSFFGNLVFCVVLLRKRYLLKKPYNILLLVLAVTDMLTGTIVRIVSPWKSKSNDLNSERSDPSNIGIKFLPYKRVLKCRRSEESDLKPNLTCYEKQMTTSWTKIMWYLF